MTRKGLLIALVVLFTSLPVFARRFILGVSPDAATSVAEQYGLTIVAAIPDTGLFLVTAPDTVDVDQLLSTVNADPNVADFEVDDLATTPEGTSSTSSSALMPSQTTNLFFNTTGFTDTGSVDVVGSGLTLDQSTAGILDSVSQASVLTYYGTQVPSYYVNQTATSLINLGAAQSIGAVGAGVVAVIDTGVDPNHAALQGVLLPGFDFTRHQPGADEFLDLDQSTAGILDQSTAGILDMNAVVTLNQSTAGILDQSTAGILDTTKLPSDFGHGTMVAGIIHLVAPQAKILPLKAFDANGTGRIYDVIAAIFYAVNAGGANVINMSFDYGHTQSPLLRVAIGYANSKGVICVASAGNTDSATAVYPAGYNLAFGIASTTTDPVPDLQSAFTNYGSWIDMAAPGEAIRTTYPGNHYAAAWGTSFSAPFVSGTVALLYQYYSPLTENAVSAALRNAVWINPNLGFGRLDAYQAVSTYVPFLVPVLVPVPVPVPVLGPAPGPG